MQLYTPLDIFTDIKEIDSIAIELINKENYKVWLSQQADFTQKYAKMQDFGKRVEVLLLPNEKGGIQKVICLITQEMFSVAKLYKYLPNGNYHIENLDIQDLSLYYIAIALGAYSFKHYKSKPNKNNNLKIYLPAQYQTILPEIEANYIVRDMITTPAEDMSPEDISKVIKKLATEFKANFSELVGQDLVNQGYMGIYTVGKASHREPRLIKLNWGDKSNPRISIIGKGVTFDTGGLDIKSSAGMILMHKDMGGAANAIGLAYIIMKHNLPVNLNLVIPTVENAIDAKSYRPSDIIKMRNGITVQVTNTDAEGRLILAEPLSDEATYTKPDLLVDFSTLTGAARVALGTEVGVFFSNNDEVANSLNKYSQETQDQVWRLPLASCYKNALETDFADISHCDLSSYGGAIKAALFLEYFLGDNPPNWIHFDIMAWNIANKDGKPKGGEMMAVRAIFALIKAKYS